MVIGQNGEPGQRVPSRVMKGFTSVLAIVQIPHPGTEVTTALVYQSKMQRAFSGHVHVSSDLQAGLLCNVIFLHVILILGNLHANDSFCISFRPNLSKSILYQLYRTFQSYFLPNLNSSHKCQNLSLGVKPYSKIWGDGAI